MKSKAALFFAMILLLPVLGTQVALAQADETLRADVPFDFYAGKQKMPAGNYQFKFDAGRYDVQIMDDARHGIFLMGSSIDPSKAANAALIFDHLGDTYFLKTLETSELDLNFSVSSAERTIASNAAATQIVVAANLH